MNERRVQIFRPRRQHDLKRKHDEEWDDADTQYQQTSLQRRKVVFEKLWSAREKAIRVSLCLNLTKSSSADEALKNALRESNAGLVEQISRFSRQGAQLRKLKTGLIMTGYGDTVQSGLYDQLQRDINSRKAVRLITMESADAPSLKTCLKNIIQKVTKLAQMDEQDEDLLANASFKGRKFLNYDLQLLKEWCQTRLVNRIIIAFKDGEAFDSNVLSDTICILASWLDRLQFVLLLGIATDVANFQDRLPPSTINLIEGQVFKVACFDRMLLTVHEALFSGQPDFWISSPVMDMLMQRQIDYVHSVDAFIQSSKYAYMAHCYGNALSVFLDPDASLEKIEKEDFEALRHLPSFRLHVESLIGNGDLQTAKALLQDDRSLFDEVLRQHAEMKTKINVSLSTGRVLLLAMTHLVIDSTPSLPQLLSTILHGQVNDKKWIADTLEVMQKLDSNALQSLLSSLLIEQHVDQLASLSPLSQQLTEVIDRSSRQGRPLLRGDATSVLRTSVIGQKVTLSKQRKAQSAEDQIFWDIRSRITAGLAAIFKAASIDLSAEFFHELVLFDNKGPLRDGFMPRPTQSIERALTSPHDYLSCLCCTSGEHDRGETTMAASHPATSIVYQLYLESGPLINIADLHSAFSSVVRERCTDEKLQGVLFARALAELKYLGLLKSSKKRADHVSKLKWRGL